MEEGTAERLKVRDRMMEAAQAQYGDPGWSAKGTAAGLQVLYTWLHGNGNFYTVEAFVPWTTIAHAPKNPLLVVMDDLAKQKKEFKP